jgi:hypothetical protein
MAMEHRARGGHACRPPGVLHLLIRFLVAPCSKVRSKFMHEPDFRTSD